MIGADNLDKLNRLDARVTPRLHFGGVVQRDLPMLAVNVERYHDGGSVSLTDGWFNPGSDMASMTPLAIPQSAIMPAAIRAGTADSSSGGQSNNNAIFINPQFQNRQSVGQTAAQLTAAMEAGKRNR